MITRILIADDHPIVRSGIKAELSAHRDFVVIGEATDGDQTMELVQQLKPDILLLDIRMPGLGLTELIKNIHSQKVSTRIIILSAYSDEGTVSSIMRLGVEGYLLKDEDPVEFPEAIRGVMRGQKKLSQAITTLLIDQVQQKNEDQLPVLTEREVAVVRHLASGKTTKEIARSLDVKERTVEFHIRRIYKKLGVNSRPPVVLWAKEQGFL